MPVIRSALLSVLLLCGVATGAVADDDGDSGDHDRALEALRDGRAMPLEDIIARANASHPGDILDVHFEDEHGRCVYEIKTITADGRILMLKYDAKTGELLKVRGHRRRHRGDRQGDDHREGD